MKLIRCWLGSLFAADISVIPRHLSGDSMLALSDSSPLVAPVKRCLATSA